MKILNSAFFVITVVGLATLPIYAGSGEKALEEAQTTFYDIMDKDITTVRFEKGSATVSDSERRDLRSLIQSVRDDSKVENIIVAAWSDKQYPSKKEKKLSDNDRKLANMRAENVSKVLNEIGAKGVQTYSMAENPGWIARVFHTEEAQIKKSIRGKEVEDRTMASIAKTLNAKGGPSTVVVLIKRELSAKSAAH